MNKHDELTARLDKLLEHFYSPYSPELISIHNKDEWSVTGRGITDARNLLQQYGDALVRIGDIRSDFAPVGDMPDYYEWHVVLQAEINAIHKFAQTTVEGE